MTDAVQRGAAPARAVRDVRIDFLRGLFIVSLCGTHFTWFATILGFSSPVRFYDMQPFGFSSPAEFFVFFSGYVMVLVLARGFGKIGYLLTQARSVDRAWSLYVLNVFTLTMVVAFAAPLFVPTSPLFQSSGMARLVDDPLGFLLRFASFRDNLAFFEILRNYIFFIPLVAVFLWLAQRSRWLPLVVSGALWLAHQVGMTPDLGYPTFNPFAWQLIFFLGGTFAITRPLTDWHFPRRGLQIAICLAILLGIFLLKMWIVPGVQSEFVPGASKAHIGPLRLAHFLMVLWGAMLIVPSSAALQGNGLARAFIAVGQNSLECFCLSNFIIYLAAAILASDAQSLLRYWGLQIAVMGAVFAGAQLFAWFKSEPWRKAVQAA